MSLLSVHGLSVKFKQRHGHDLIALDNVSFSLQRGERLAIVGESGAGKSLLGYALVNLLAKPGYVATGRIVLDGRDLTPLTAKQWQEIRGQRIAMIFQDPMVTLNPVLSVGEQMVEAIRSHTRMAYRDAKKLAIETLVKVRMAAPVQRFAQYPHELSGGMRQRVIIAISLLLSPDIIIADEPTTALDVTIQAEILQLLTQICEDNGVALILITHDFGVVSRIAERTLVMYAGRLVEQGPTLAIINDPQHPYTQGLLNALPQMALPGQRLNQIQGNMPPLNARPSGCAFHPRCPYAQEKCRQQPPLFIASGASSVACYAIENMIQEVDVIEAEGRYHD